MPRFPRPMSGSPDRSRRRFIREGALASAAALAFPAIMRGQTSGGHLVSRLNLAFVGVGGRAKFALEALADENYVAFCDVDDARAAEAYEKFPSVPRFRDYREMFAQMGDRIDGVVVSTPDHMHFPVAMSALALRKHLYVEKPLTHTVGEARLMAAAARRAGVITQMGNQGHSMDGTRILREWIEAGTLGEIREIHSWTNRPTWPQGVALPDHEKKTPVIPASLDWNLWLGVAEERPYDPAYAPFRWRGWWDFGCGALGDMACHVMDAAYWGLGLTAPVAVAATATPVSAASCPQSSLITYEFPARGARPALIWKWHDGGLAPALPPDFEMGRKVRYGSGSFIIGTKASVLASTYNESVRIFPEARMRELAPHLPLASYPRLRSGHYELWAQACRAGVQPASHFDYAGPFTETVLLGNVALRARRRIEWDAATMKIPNLSSAEAYLTKVYRPGFY